MSSGNSILNVPYKSVLDTMEVEDTVQFLLAESIINCEVVIRHTITGILLKPAFIEDNTAFSIL